MKHLHSSGVGGLLALWLLAAAVQGFGGQAPSPADAAGTHTYTVFLRSRAVGQEIVSVAQRPDGWIVRGSNSLGPPLDVVTRNAEIQYDSQWRPTRMLLEGTSRGQDVSITSTFANGQATTAVVLAGKASDEVDAVAPDAVVLPNAFLGSYAALARRLIGAERGTMFHGYIAPQGQVPMRVDGVFAERIETPREAIAATRYALLVSNPPPGGDLQLIVWTDQQGRLLRMSVPAQMLDVAREDIASAATRTTSFSLPGDEAVRIPASGFGLAASVTTPSTAKGSLPAVILVGGSGPTDRDGLVAGIPVLGQLAGDLVEAGFLVVRYDKRGVGQSGGRAETSTLADYAEDVRAIVRWLEKEREDVDDRRIAVVGHSEGAWVAMQAAARDRRIAALALVAAPSTTGAELVLEQQRHLLERMKTPDAEKQAKIELQKQINAAAVTGSGWENIPAELRKAADSPWFQSFLSFDPARVMKDVRQPVLVVQGQLDTQVRPHHAETLGALAKARNRKVAADVAVVPGVNHLLVPAKTGEVDEYATLPDKEVASAVTATIATWLARVLG
jgi:pimeloyl-ACP methyl ester carboxylesterase